MMSLSMEAYSERKLNHSRPKSFELILVALVRGVLNHSDHNESIKKQKNSPGAIAYALSDNTPASAYLIMTGTITFPLLLVSLIIEERPTDPANGGVAGIISPGEASNLTFTDPAHGGVRGLLAQGKEVFYINQKLTQNHMTRLYRLCF
jgi:hypothetical protein